MEYEIFCTIREKIVRETLKILETAKKIAYIDVLACFAEVAEKYDYCRPKINNESKITIKEGRHPIWAIIQIKATCRRYVDFPAIFGPVIIKICSLSVSK